MKVKRILSLLMCVALLCGLALTPIQAEETESHAHEELTVHPEQPSPEDPASSPDQEGEDAPLPAPAAEPGGDSAPEPEEDVPAPVEAPVHTYSPNVGEHEHQWGEMTSVTIPNDCVYGKTWVACYICSVCGATRSVAWRPYGSWTEGSHTLGAEESFETDCPQHPTTQKTCTVCGYVEKYEKGGHVWIETREAGPNGILTVTRTCKYCHETKTETGSQGTHEHVWGDLQTRPATCTEAGANYVQCTVCGAESIRSTLQPLGHDFSGGTDCTVDTTCSRCAEVRPGETAHSWSDVWSSDGQTHWHACQNEGCQARTDEAAHTVLESEKSNCEDPEPCTVCGQATRTPGTHDFTGDVVWWGAMSHKVCCRNCDAYEVVHCSVETAVGERTDCTKPLLCVCGQTVIPAQKNHNFGTWICHDSSHTHKCLNKGCTYGETQPHTWAAPAADGVLLCSVCNAISGEPIAVPSIPQGNYTQAITNGHAHVWGDMQSTEEGYNCETGTSWIAYQTCTICGALKQTAFRPNGEGKGQHNWVEYTIDDGCNGNPTTLKTCTICCQTVEVSPGGHIWETKTKAASCTESGYEKEVCANCRAEQNVRTLAPLGHSFPARTDCTDVLHCTRCQAVSIGKDEHTWGAWQSNGSSHWRVCVNAGCSQRQTEAHTPGTRTTCTDPINCTVCGRQLQAAGQHSFGDPVPYGATAHLFTCTVCKATSLGHCSEATAVSGLYDCTQDLVCVCGQTIREGQKNHNYGTWICHDSSHEHKCLNPTCNRSQAEPHTPVTQKVDRVTKVVCSVCAMVLSESAPAPAVHTEHTFGPWVGDASGHTRTCTWPDCGKTEHASHSGGAATCASPAVCEICGASYGETASTHSGGTELRGFIKAEIGKEGYSGDTVCLRCGAVLSKGHALPALPQTDSGAEKNPDTPLTQDGQHDASSPKDDAGSGAAPGGSGSSAPARPSDEGTSGGSSASGSSSNPSAPSGGSSSGGSGSTGSSGGGSSTGGNSSSSTPTGGSSSSGSGSTGSSGSGSTTGSSSGSSGNGFIAAPAGSGSQSAGSSDTPAVSQPSQAPETTGQTPAGDAPEALPAPSFADVADGAWYGPAVQRVAQSGLMKGTGAGVFDPGMLLDRAQIAAILYRMAGEPAQGSAARFRDAEAGAWYADAVAWAAQNGVMEGADGLFAPGRSLTRQELAVAFYRYAKQAGLNTGAAGSLSAFADAGSVASWADEAVTWAAASGLLQGSDGRLNPSATATRAEVAAILDRYLLFFG